MIYTRWGNEIKIISNCGKHTPPDFVSPVTLVKVERQCDKEIRFRFVEFLRADNGIKEILNNLPKQVTVLPVEELIEALKQAS